MLPWISAHDLRARLDEPGLRLVDVRFELGRPEAGRDAYATGHLPGAVYLDLDRELSSPVGRHGGRHPLPDVGELAAAFGRAGIDHTTHVVAYDAADAMVASRLWWLLRWTGHDAVQVLDGGLAAWSAAGGELTTSLPDVPATTYTPVVRQELVVDRGDVSARLGRSDVALVDARSPERYRGEVEPLDPRAGHLPGAVNRPYTENLGDHGGFRTPADLRAHYGAIAEASEVIVYCGSGVSAAHDLMALEAAGVRGARLYAGSWSDWVSYGDAPVALGAEDDA